MPGTVGDKVRMVIPHDGRPPSVAYVIGHMAYGADVLLVADEDAIGMPINEAHCQVISSGHDEQCRRWFDRYDKMYTGAAIWPT